MKEFFKSVKWNTLFSALICVCVGLALFFRPEELSRLTCQIIAILILLVGVVHLVYYLMERRVAAWLQIDLLVGVVLIALGLWMLFATTFFISLIPFVLGAIILVHGIQDIRYGENLRTLGYRNWWAALFIGILCAVAGVLMIIHPFRSAQTIIKLIGIFLAVDGLSDLWIVSRLSKSARTVKTALREEKEKIQDYHDGVVYTVDDVKEEDIDD